MKRCAQVTTIAWILAAAAFTALAAPGAVEPVPEVLLDDRDVIWSLEFEGPRSLLFTEKSGKIGRLNLDTRAVTPITGVPAVADHGQGGLLDLRLHPDQRRYPGLLFLTYAREVEEGGTTKYLTQLARAKLVGNALTELRELVQARPAGTGGVHFGSRIAFDADGGAVLFSASERGVRDDAQRLDTMTGKILRVRLDGSVPPDNPFVGRAGARPEIWSYGHRNVQGLQRDPDTGVLYAHEHGPQGGDEINRIVKGANYGWPVATYGEEYGGGAINGGKHAAPGLEPPLHWWTPSIAPSGLAIRGGEFFSGALVLTHLNRIRLAPTKREIRMFESMGERVRELRFGPDGKLYFSTDSGKILRFTVPSA